MIPKNCWENLSFPMDARGKVLSSFHVFKNIAVYAKVEEKHVTIYLIFEVEKMELGRDE